MRLMLASLVTAIALAAPASAETKSYNLSGFKKIEATTAFKIVFTQSSTWSVKVDSRNNNLDQIIVEKIGDTLKISRPKGFCAHVTRDGSQAPKNSKWGQNCLEHDVDDVITISAPDIDALTLNTAIKFSAGNLNLDALRIDANAAVVIEIANLKINTLDIEADAAAKVTLAGSCTRLDVQIGAASHLDAANFKCRETNIDAGTASSVHAYASEKAVAKAGVASSVVMSGKPRTFEKSAAKFSSSVSLAD